MRKKLIHLAKEMGYTKDGKADMDKINAWCLHYGYGKKELNKYAYNELPKLLSQFEKVYEYYIKNL